ALNKPPGLAVQGGTGTVRHLDAMLDALRFGCAERPRLVHRLDRDTSGVLLLGRNAAAARALAEAFRDRTTRKLYWAITVGVPRPLQGKIDLPLAKLPGRAGERMAPDEEEGKRAVTYYKVLEHMGKKAAWVALWPVTGRTHQLRVHLAAIGTPILSDGKYGGKAAFLSGEKISRKLHLHARALTLPHPKTGRPLTLTAPLPEHMRASWRLFGFDPERRDDPFAGLEV
ncbi:MAG TPA: RluA family pseudouridine synthase, partial [Alphaproteobacteria bacterium]|nr:RluA family pseudouridine synthase [Alphaproteobacteria bacterium]